MSFINRNVSKNFNMTIPTSIVALSAFDCGEALVVNRTGGDIYVYTELGLYSNDRRFLLKEDEGAFFQGITNSNQLSAIADTEGTVYVLTSRFSNTPSPM
jgi:hypothetical protein